MLMCAQQQSNPMKKKRKTFVVNNFDVNRLVAEFNRTQNKNTKFRVRNDGWGSNAVT